MAKQISNELLRAIRENPLPRFQLAALAGLHPSTLYRLLHGCTAIKDGDARVLAIARILGVDKRKAFISEDN